VWLSLQIADNGPGIDPEVLPHLFEPFVSTRLDSRGTGLGLAVSEGIIREHGGLLLARNRVQPRGAVFEILLPLQAEPAPTG
jgi:signal transduction histidine kinase